MEVSSARIIEGINEIFPESESMALTIKTILGELPEWDSMAAVTFQTFLNKQFEVDVPIELLADETSLEEVITFVKNPGSNENAW